MTEYLIGFLGIEEIAKKAIKVASEICVFTNNNITMEKL